MTATTFDTTPVPDAERVDGRRLLWATPLAAVVAAALNALIFLIGRAGGTLTDDVGLTINGQTQPLTLGPVIGSTIVPILVAGVLLALLGRFARRPIRVFTIVAAVVFVLSLATPFTLPGADLAYRATLLLMHVMAAAVAVGLLTRLGRAAC